MTEIQKALAETTADVVDEMLELDGRAAVTWRQAARALRAGDAVRAIELLGTVSELVEGARVRAEKAAQGIFVLAAAVHLEGRAEKVIILTTPPHDKNGTGGSDNGN